MSEPSDPNLERNALRDQIIGLGVRSVRKSYYPQLQQQIDELEKAKAALEEKSDSLLHTLHDLETARQRAEENEGKFRMLFEGIVDGVVVADVETQQFQKVNPAFCQMLGYTEEELLSLTIPAIHPPEELPRITKAIAKQGYASSVLLKNLLFKRKDGTIFYTDVNSILVNFENRRCVLGVCRDTTGRRLAEEALKKSEQKYRELVENANSIILRWSPDGIITYLNEFGLTFFGYSENEILRRQASGTIVPETESTGRNLVPLMSKIRADPKTFEHNINENIRRNGERVWIAWTNKVVLDNKGQIKEILSIGSDITERKRAEDELHRLNRLYAVLSQVNQAVIHAASHQEFLEQVCKIAIEFGLFKMAWVGRINPETQQVIPVAVAGDEGGYLDKITVYADDRPEGRGPIGTSIRQEQTYVCNDFHSNSCTLPWREAALGVGFQAIISLPLRNEGRIFGALAVYTGELNCFHVKEVTLLEEVASDISFALDHLDQEKRRQQDEMALKDAKEAAETANRAKDQFIAVLSHELRTPLTPVLTTVALLQSHEEMPDEIRSEIDIIRRNVELEAKLIDDLLDVTRISRGILELHREEVNVHACIMKTLEICRNEIAEKGVEVSLSLRAKDFHVWADSARLQQVLWNLLKNAVKFTPDEGRISIRTTNTDKRLQIEIADTGIGIEPDVLPKIFNAFEQGEKTWTRRFGGLGLGLSIARSIVELHEGSLTAYSEGQNKGSVFTVDLETMASAPGSPFHGYISSSQRGEQRKILLVEDHADTLRILSILLQKWGYIVKGANCVAKALDLASSESFDILVSDIGLPDGSGLDIMRQTKERYGLRGVALSGFGTDDDRRESRAAGFDAHLTKPIGVESLRVAIERILSANRG